MSEQIQVGELTASSELHAVAESGEIIEEEIAAELKVGDPAIDVARAILEENETGTTESQELE